MDVDVDIDTVYSLINATKYPILPPEDSTLFY